MMKTMKNKRIYIAGGMSGLPNLNYPAFNAEAARLRALGFDVVNPAELTGADLSWEACMRRGLAELVTCNAIHMLEGWEKSRGANIEYKLACALGFEVTFDYVPEPAATSLSRTSTVVSFAMPPTAK